MSSSFPERGEYLGLVMGVYDEAEKVWPLRTELAAVKAELDLLKNPPIPPPPVVLPPSPTTPPTSPPNTIPVGFPTAATTGVPTGLSLYNVGKMIDVTDSGVFVDGTTASFPSSGTKEIFPGCELGSDGVLRLQQLMITRLRNRSTRFKIKGKHLSVKLPVGTLGPQYVIDGTQSKSSEATIEVDECDIYGAQANVVLAWKNFIARKCDISGGLDAVRLGSNTHILDSFLHDLERAPGSHNDILQMIGGSNASAVGNTMLVAKRSADGSGKQFSDGWYDPMNAALMLGNLTSNVTNLLIDRNYVDGGNYTFNVNWLNIDAGLHALSNVRIINNLFGRHFRYGPKASVKSPIVWTGNKYADTGANV